MIITISPQSSNPTIDWDDRSSEYHMLVEYLRSINRLELDIKGGQYFSHKCVGENLWDITMDET